MKLGSPYITRWRLSLGSRQEKIEMLGLKTVQEKLEKKSEKLHKKQKIGTD